MDLSYEDPAPTMSNVHLDEAGKTALPDTPLSPATSPESPESPASPLHVKFAPNVSYAGQPDLPCIRFLKTHFAEGGIDGNGYNMLYRMIEMMSAMDWEVHVTCTSEIPSIGTSAKIFWYATCILQGCEAFHENMQPAVDKARFAIRTLPALEGDGDELVATFKQWRRTLRNLHEPLGNDTRLFKLVLRHCASVYKRLVTLNTMDRSYKLENVVDVTAKVYLAVEYLIQTAQEADYLVACLDTMFESFVRQQNEISARQSLLQVHQETAAYQQSLEQSQASVAAATYQQASEQSETQIDQQAQHQKHAYEQSPEPSPQLLAPVVYQQTRNEANLKINPLLSKSFSAAEEELGRRHHVRTSTFTPSDYVSVPKSPSFAQPQTKWPFQGTAIGSRRNGAYVPRIFTGSFSQLESDLRRLQLDKVGTPDEPPLENDPIKIRDFGATPAISPCTSPGLCVPLQRREALLSKDSEFQDRVINGAVVKSRRPSTKHRAQTIDDMHGGLEAWLKEDPPTTHMPDTPGSAVRRGNLKHRENTL